MLRVSDWGYTVWSVGSTNFFGHRIHVTSGVKNIGFTNVLRVSGKKAGILTLIGDLGKGFLVAWLAKQATTQEFWILVIAFAVITGHVFSLFLGFQGGKGVATALGAVLGLDFMLGLLLVVIWFVAVAVFRYSSGGALAAFCLLPILVLSLSYSTGFIIFSFLVSFLIIIKHKDNILRLLSGEERKISLSSS